MSQVPQRSYGPALAPPRLRVVADDGCVLNLHRLHSGATPEAPPVIFLHALAMDGLMWHGVAAALAARSMHPGALYALDCRGHGASGSGTIPYTTAGFASDVSAALNTVGTRRAHVVGCSMGGTVALAFAARHPERTASLAVVDATAWYGLDAPSQWEKRAQTALAGGMSALVDFQVARWFSPAFAAQEPALVRQALAVFLANQVPAYVSSCRMLGQADERAGLPAYRGPAAVVVGEEDYATPPAMAEDIAARLQGAQLTVLPHTRHYTPLENPEQVAACIAALLQR